MENKTIQSLNDRRVRKQNQIACLNDLESKIKGVELGADGEAASVVAKRVQQAITSHNFFTVSMGIAVFPEDVSTLKELIQKADKMLYKAKRNGKNQFCICNQ